MTTKNRLDELKAVQVEHREEEGVPYGEDDTVLDIEENTDLRNDPVMGEFFKEVEQLRELTLGLQSQVEKVKRIQSSLLSSPSTNEKLKAELEDLEAVIKKTGNSIRFALKKIEKEMEGELDDPEDSLSSINPRSPADRRIRKTQHFTLTREFIEVMTEYNRAQTDYRERVKSKLQRQLEIAGRAKTDEELEDMISQGNPSIFTDGIQMGDNLGEQTLAAKQTLADIQARHEDIVKLEQSIRELHEMFMDMAMLMEAQGEMIDRIESHVNDGVEYVEKATGDMKKALEFQSAARRKKIITGIVSTLITILVCYVLAKYLGFV